MSRKTEPTIPATPTRTHHIPDAGDAGQTEAIHNCIPNWRKNGGQCCHGSHRHDGSILGVITIAFFYQEHSSRFLLCLWILDFPAVSSGLRSAVYPCLVNRSFTLFVLVNFSFSCFRLSSGRGITTADFPDQTQVRLPISP